MPKSFSRKVVGFQAVILLKKRLCHRCFSANFKILLDAFFMVNFSVFIDHVFSFSFKFFLRCKPVVLWDLYFERTVRLENITGNRSPAPEIILRVSQAV